MLDPMPSPIEKYAPIPARIGMAAALGALFFAVYGGCNTLTAWRAAQGENIPTLAFAWERRIPLIPWTAAPYWSEDLFFVLARVANNNGVKDVLWIPGNNGDVQKGG